MFTAVLVCLAALLLDYSVGEPRRAHPLVGLGRLANRIEALLNKPEGGSVFAGLCGLLAVIAFPLALISSLQFFLPSFLQPVLAVVVLWLALGLRSLGEHGRAVAVPLAAGELEKARQAVGRIVSRDTQGLDDNGVATAATESMLENGADAVFASLFWFLVAGLPGVVLHRTVNTLDAMWGYRNGRFNRFGRVAARLDDGLNYVPARLTAITYACLGHTRQALQCWRHQARAWDSPNAGPVMAAGAGALAVRLGGGAPYHGQWRERPVLGQGQAPTAATIILALRLVQRGVLLWLVVVGLISLGIRFLL